MSSKNDKKLQDAERQVRADEREKKKYLADIKSGKYVNERSHTPPHAQKRFKIEQFLNPHGWTNDFRGGKKRTKKMLKKRRRTNKRK